MKSEDLAFRTREGLPLITDTSDAVRQAWDDWRAQARLEHTRFGFYALRRYFGDYATQVGGEGAGDTALAHTAKSVRGRHYSGYRDFNQVREIGQRLYTELKGLGMFENVIVRKSISRE